MNTSWMKCESPLTPTEIDYLVNINKYNTQYIICYISVLAIKTDLPNYKVKQAHFQQFTLIKQDKINKNIMLFWYSTVCHQLYTSKGFTNFHSDHFHSYTFSSSCLIQSCMALVVISMCLFIFLPNFYGDYQARRQQVPFCSLWYGSYGFKLWSGRPGFEPYSHLTDKCSNHQAIVQLIQ